MSDNITNRQIHELDPLYKIKGKDEILIDDGKVTYRTTVDTLLGYIAKQINEGTFPEEMFQTASIINIPEGTSLPASGRTPGNYYLRECSYTDAQLNAGLNPTIVVSPNMALRIVNK